MKVRYIVAAALMLSFLAGCGTVKSGASGQTDSPAVSTAVTATDNTPAAGASSEASPAGEPSAEAGGVTAIPGDATATPVATPVVTPVVTADPDETKEVLNGILDQLNQLDQLYSDMDEVSDSDLTLD